MQKVHLAPPLCTAQVFRAWHWQGHRENTMLPMIQSILGLWIFSQVLPTIRFFLPRLQTANVTHSVCPSICMIKLMVSLMVPPLLSVLSTLYTGTACVSLRIVRPFSWTNSESTYSPVAPESSSASTVRVAPVLTIFSSILRHGKSSILLLLIYSLLGGVSTRGIVSLSRVVLESIVFMPSNISSTFKIEYLFPDAQPVPSWHLLQNPACL